MKRLIVTAVMALMAASPLLLAQKGKSKKDQAQEEPKKGGCPIPNTKSLGECKAVIEMLQAQGSTPDAAIEKAEDLITKYADTSYKDMALFAEANAWNMKGDKAKAQVYGEQTLAANPKNIQAPNLLGRLIVQQTGEHDLDKDQKLAQAEKYFNLAFENLKTAAKPFEQTPDAQWDSIKKGVDADAHDGMGLVQLDRKNYEAAIAQFKQASEDTPDEAAYQVRLASAYQQAGKKAEAIAVCDKLLANPQLNPQIKTVTQNIKAMASK